MQGGGHAARGMGEWTCMRRGESWPPLCMSDFASTAFCGLELLSFLCKVGKDTGKDTTRTRPHWPTKPVNENGSVLTSVDAARSRRGSRYLPLAAQIALAGRVLSAEHAYRGLGPPGRVAQLAARCRVLGGIGGMRDHRWPKARGCMHSKRFRGSRCEGHRRNKPSWRNSVWLVHVAEVVSASKEPPMHVAQPVQTAWVSWYKGKGGLILLQSLIEHYLSALPASTRADRNMEARTVAERSRTQAPSMVRELAFPLWAPEEATAAFAAVHWGWIRPAASNASRQNSRRNHSANRHCSQPV